LWGAFPLSFLVHLLCNYKCKGTYRGCTTSFASNMKSKNTCLRLHDWGCCILLYKRPLQGEPGKTQGVKKQPLPLLLRTLIGSRTMISASAPAAMRPLRGYMLKVCAAAVLVIRTKSMGVIIPVVANFE